MLSVICIMLTVLGSFHKKVLEEWERLIPSYLGRYLVTKTFLSKLETNPTFLTSVI